MKRCKKRDDMKLLRILLAVLIPSVGVFMSYGFGPTLLINIGLTLLGWLPGSIHGLWAVVKHEEKLSRQEEVY